MLSAHVCKIEIDLANCFIPMDSKSLFHVISGILWEHVWLSKYKIQKIVNRVITGFNNETERWLNYPVISSVYLSHKHMKLYFQLFVSNFVTFLSFTKKFYLVWIVGCKWRMALWQVPILVWWAQAPETGHSHAQELVWGVGGCRVGRCSYFCSKGSQGLSDIVFLFS